MLNFFKKRRSYDARQLKRLEGALKIKFKDLTLLRQAVTHRSYVNEHPEIDTKDYERLEYLGDAFLGFVVAEELFVRYPEMQEGALTRARSLLVQGRTLAEIARTLDLGGYIYLGQGEEESGGRNRQANLAAALEAIIGATLISQGENTARNLIFALLEPRIKAIGETGAPRDPKSALQELAQKSGFALPTYRVVEEEGLSHDRRFIVEVWIGDKLAGQGRGRRKLEAEKTAAQQALLEFTDIPSAL